MCSAFHTKVGKLTNRKLLFCLRILDHTISIATSTHNVLHGLNQICGSSAATNSLKSHKMLIMILIRPT